MHHTSTKFGHVRPRDCEFHPVDHNDEAAPFFLHKVLDLGHNGKDRASDRRNRRRYIEANEASLDLSKSA